MNVTEPTVHIVDDDASFLAAISRLLRAKGFAVKTFASASAFLAEADCEAPGCVLVDVRMPGMSGLDLIDLLRSRHFSAPAILITSDPSPSVRERASKASVPIVEKPLLGNALLRQIRDVAGDGRS
jgi:FixJ family two-component response regulator